MRLARVYLTDIIAEILYGLGLKTNNSILIVYCYFQRKLSQLCVNLQDLLSQSRADCP